VTPGYLNRHTQTRECATVRGTFARPALHCRHNLPGELTPQHEASVTRHLLSGTHFLGQYLIVPHWQFFFKSRLKTHPFHLADNDWRDLTCSATASQVEVTTLRQYRNVCFIFKRRHRSFFIVIVTMLSYRKETALQGALQFSPKVEDWNWETIFYGHYRSIFNLACLLACSCPSISTTTMHRRIRKVFNHCDIIRLKICRIPWKKAK